MKHLIEAIEQWSRWLTIILKMIITMSACFVARLLTGLPLCCGHKCLALTSSEISSKRHKGTLK